MNNALDLSEELLISAFHAQASDIHFYPNSKEVHIYFRINGQRVLQVALEKEVYQLLLTYYKFTSGMDIGEIRKPQNGAMNYQTDAHHYALRFSTLPLNKTESLAIRILSQDRLLTLDELFLFPYQLKKLKSWMVNRAGLILLTGPTGSGKTTTLYALLETILKEKSYQAITLEDPVEKEIDNILQVQVNEKAGITYQAGLKAALRHDPDIIMVGEIRDKETAKFAFEAALTGHLVLSTLHAKNAQGTIQRLLEMEIKRTDIEQTLIAVAAVQLLSIQVNETIQRRAAILELLEGDYIEAICKGGNIDQLPHGSFDSFEDLRKKAFAYGFIDEEIYFNH